MTRRKKILFAQVAVVAAIPIVLYAYAEGPDATLAGVPGESTCAACHGGGSGTGSVTITFSNGMSYTPGVTQRKCCNFDGVPEIGPMTTPTSRS